MSWTKGVAIPVPPGKTARSILDERVGLSKILSSAEQVIAASGDPALSELAGKLRMLCNDLEAEARRKSELSFEHFQEACILAERIRNRLRVEHGVVDL
jgi:hypothetical protein